MEGRNASQEEEEEAAETTCTYSVVGMTQERPICKLAVGSRGYLQY